MKQSYSSEDRMDDLFRKSMEDHRVEPDPSVWKGINRKLLWREIIRLNFSNLSKSYWKLALIGSLVTSVAIYMVMPDMTKNENIVSIQQSDKPSNPQQSEAATQPSPETKHQTSNTTSVQPSATTTTTHPAFAAVGGKSTISQPVEAGNVQSTTNQSVVSENQIREASELTVVGDVIQHETPEVIHNLEPIESNITGLTYLTPLRMEKLHSDDTIITIQTIKGAGKFMWHTGKSKQMVSITAGVLPEVAFYRQPDKYMKSNYWVHGGVAYSVSRFAISSALELGYMLDDGKYRIDYKSHDSVGYFANVVSYTVGMNNELFFNTQNITLYDSILHADNYRTQDRYTYLRVPLLFGYRLLETNKFSLGLNVGPAISFLLGTRKSDPVIEYANARIIRVDEETPDRMKTNWQLWANLFMEMKITRKIGLYVEPSFKYFMKPTAEQENPEATPPWSFGLGVGLQFNFEPKKINR